LKSELTTGKIKEKKNGQHEAKQSSLVRFIFFCLSALSPWFSFRREIHIAYLMSFSLAGSRPLACLLARSL